MADDVPDHYAALELPTTCTLEEINKAYRKLALKYHPDRNRGKEEDVVPRFQAIQAAHETLKDAQTRKRYDLSRPDRPRPSYSYGSGAAGRPAPKGNPYQARSDFPPPPSRTNPRRGQGNNAPRPNDSFFPPPPPPRPTPPKASAFQDANDRANMFNAWESMNGRKSPPKKAQGTWAGGFGSQTDPWAKQQRTSSDDLPRKSAYDTAQGGSTRPDMPRTPSHRASKRGGFDPSTPGGDEKPAPRNGYGTSHLRSDFDSAPNLNGSAAPRGHAPRGHAPTARRPESGYFDTESPRASQKDNLRRSASAQDMPDLNPPPERGPFGRSGYNNRNRSTSPQRRAPPSKAFPTYESSDSDKEPTRVRPAAPSPVAPDPKDRPKATPRARRSGTSTPVSNPPTAVPATEKPSIFSFTPQSNMFDRSFGQRPSFDNINTNFTSSTNTTAFGAPPEMQRPSQPDTSTPSFTFGGAPQSVSAQTTTTTTPVQGPQQPPPKSADGSLPTGAGTFSAAQWQQTLNGDNWASKWANPPQTQPFAPGSPTRRSKSVKGSRVPSNQPRPATLADEEAGPPTEWTESDSNAMDVDPTPTSIPIPKPTQAPFASTIPEVQPVEPSPFITSVPPPTANGQARGVYVEPTNASWTSHPSAASTTQSGFAQYASTTLPGPPPPPAANTRPGTFPRPPPVQAPPIDLNSLHNVAPFASSLRTSGPTPGLSSFSDVTSTLPFPSQPSKAPTSAHPTIPAVDLPKPPKAPAQPKRNEELEGYVRAMAAYLAAWSKFKMDMAGIMLNAIALDERMEGNCFSGLPPPQTTSSSTTSTAETSADPMSLGTMPNWLLAAGETEKSRGWESYKRGLKEEERVRMYLNVACDRHRDAMECHERLREGLKRRSGV